MSRFGSAPMDRAERPMRVLLLKRRKRRLLNHKLCRERDPIVRETLQSQLRFLDLEQGKLKDTIRDLLEKDRHYSWGHRIKDDHSFGIPM